MLEKSLTVAEIGQIAGTRVLLGAGIGLMLARKLNDDQRKSAGWALLVAGILSTIPIAANIFGRKTPEGRSIPPERVPA